MKVFATILLAALCVVGCDRAPKDSNYHDPALRQQLTTMLSDLHSDKKVPKAIRDLDAILSVYSSKLSPAQRSQLSSAKEKLQKMNDNLKAYVEMQARPDYTDAKGSASTDEYLKFFHEAKDLITQTATTL